MSDTDKTEVCVKSDEAASSALAYLLAQEWSMGNGQCPECCGCPESWHGHPCHMTPDTIGHDPDCKLALAITDLGGVPVFKGDYAPGYHYEYKDKTIFCLEMVKVFEPNCKVTNSPESQP